MKRQNQKHSAPLRGEGYKNRYISLLLLILALFSSVMAGFLIGRNTGSYRGQILDTIIIGSDESRELHIAGQVLYSDGTAYANGRVELRSSPRITTTDGRGCFFYESARPGVHTLSVLDEEGNALAKCEFTISRDAEAQPVSILRETDGKYVVDLAVEVRYIELAVELDTEAGTLKLIPEKTAVLEDDGTLIVGDTELKVTDGVVVLPSGTVFLTDKTVVTGGNLILPDNTVMLVPEEGYFCLNGEEVGGDGRINLQDGTVIMAGEVKKPDGTVMSPEEPYQIPSGTAAGASHVPGEGSPAVTTPESAGIPGAINPSKAPGSPSQLNPAVSSEPVKPTGLPEPTTPSEPSEPPEPTVRPDTGELAVEGENAGGWLIWESQSSIDLFYNRTNGPADRIQPGSSGYYRFRLNNTRQGELQITITLSEDRLHIPLKLTLTPLDAQGKKSGEGVEGSLVNGTLALSGVIEAKAVTAYQLDWEWPYEGEDGADTAAGMAGGDYIVSLQVFARERS